MCQKTWDSRKPAVGQCAVTTLIVQDEFGGELMRTVVDGFGSHYYNRLPDGSDLDLTRIQFPSDVHVPPGVVVLRQDVLNSARAVAARTKERYELLRQYFDHACAGALRKL